MYGRLPDSSDADASAFEGAANHSGSGRFPNFYSTRKVLLYHARHLTKLVRSSRQTAYRDGTTHVLFNPLDFMAKLAALVPKPRTNLTRFHGVLAPNSRYRESVTPLSVRQVEPASADVEADGREEPNPGAGKRKGLCWAKRLKRVFNIDVSVCSACGGPMKIIASIEDPTVIGRILSHLEATSCAPPSGLAECGVGARAPPPGGC